MHDDYDNESDPAEQEIFRSLGSNPPRSRSLENQVVGALKQRGLIQAAVPPRWLRPAQFGAVLAAVLVAFVLGAQYGSRQAERGRELSSPEPAGSMTPSRPSLPVGSPPGAPELEAGPEGQRDPMPPSIMLTAFHMDQEQPLAFDPGNYSEDPLCILGKPVER